MSAFFEHIAITLVGATIGGLMLGGMIQVISKIQLALGVRETSAPEMAVKAQTK